MKTIYLVTGGKQPDKKLKNGGKFETKKLQILSRIDNLDKVRLLNFKTIKISICSTVEAVGRASILRAVSTARYATMSRV